MNSSRGMLLGAVAVLLALLLGSSLFVVQEYETALLLRLGKIVAADFKPGIHFKVPFIQSVVKLDGRLQTLDAKPEHFATSEQRFVVVDSYVKWRIDDASLFYRSTNGGDMLTASRRLSERVNAALRDEFGKHTINEVISGERAEIMQVLTGKADKNASDLGIKVVDVRIKRIDPPARTRNRIYEQMRTDREKQARKLRAEGAQVAEKTRAEADREKTEILAKAYGDAQKIRGEGDAKAANIYAKAFQQDPEFYAFWRSLKAYRKAFGDGRGVMVLNPDSEFFRYFRNRKGTE